MSGCICDEYAAKDTRVIVIHQKNGGVSVARNIGVRSAVGEYITFIDSDDWVEDNYLETLYSTCVDNDADITICDYEKTENEKIWNGNSKEWADCFPIQVFSRRDALEYYFELNYNCNKAQIRAPWGKLIKKHIVTKFPFPIDRTYAEDAACVYQWIWQSEKIVNIDSVLYYYYINLNGICQTKMGSHILGNFITEKEWLRFMKKNNFHNLYRMTCIRLLDDCIWFYNGLDNNEKYLAINVLKKGLLKYGKVAGYTVKTKPYHYELAFPFFMRYYWLFKSQINKLKKRDSSND